MPGVTGKCPSDLSSLRKIWNILIKWIKNLDTKSNLFLCDECFNLLPELLIKAFLKETS